MQSDDSSRSYSIPPCFASPSLAVSKAVPAFTRDKRKNVSRTPLRMGAAGCDAVGRRALLVRVAASTAAFAAVTMRPKQADALSKKRILAKAGPEVVLDSGIRYRDVSTGKGYSPQKGDTVAVHYSVFYDDLEVESSRESQGLAALPLGFSFGAESGPGAAMKVGMHCLVVAFATAPSECL